MLIKVSSEIPVDSFCVVQERGANSTVEVFEEVYADYPRDKKALRFVSDQSLASNSERAWNVTKAIENYAKPKGFDTNRYTQSPNKNELIAFYDASFHSHMVEFQLREQIKSDERYQEKLQSNIQIADTVNREYGIAVRQLKNLITALEEKNKKELDQLNRELITVQTQVLNELEIPEVLTEQDKKFLFEPHYPIDQVKMDAYNNYGQGYTLQGNGKLPDDLDSILALLD